MCYWLEERVESIGMFFGAGILSGVPFYAHLALTHEMDTWIKKKKGESEKEDKKERLELFHGQNHVALFTQLDTIIIILHFKWNKEIEY